MYENFTFPCPEGWEAQGTLEVLFLAFFVDFDIITNQLNLSDTSAVISTTAQILNSGKTGRLVFESRYDLLLDILNGLRGEQVLL